MRFNKFSSIFVDKADPDRVIKEIDGFELSHEALAARVEEVRASRILRGHRSAAICLPNGIEFLVWMIACNLENVVYSPIPYFCTSSELESVCKYGDCSILITDRGDLTSDNWQSIGPEFSLVHESKKVGVHQAEFGSDIAALYYSSGTTGSPKGVLYSNENILALSVAIVDGFGFTSRTRHLALLPFGHTASMNYNILPILYTGSDFFISTGFEQLFGRFFKVLAEHRINYTQIVPTIAFALNKARENIANLDLGSLMFIGCGSSTLPLSTQQEFMKYFQVKLANLYGLSETGPSHIDDPREEGWIQGSIGRPLPTVECQLSSRGEILISGPTVFKGYYKNRVLTNKVVKGGWFYTGDQGRYQNRRLVFVDRRKDVINKGGFNIAPLEIENVLHKYPKVLESAVVGVPDEVSGERVVALVVLVEAGMVNKQVENELKTLCRQFLSRHKVPDEIMIVESLFKTQSGKLSRSKTREKLLLEER